MDVVSLVGMTPTAPDPRYLTTPQVMEVLHIRSRVTLRAYEREGLPFHQLRPNGRKLYDPAQVAAWIDSRCTTRAPGEGESVA